MRRCKDHIGSRPPSVLICRVSPYFRTMSLWTRTGPCTSVLIMGLDWYPYQCFWCQFGGARTESFLPHQHAQIVLELCMHLWITLFTSSMYIRKPHPQFSWCEDQKTGWCTKAHTNFFANGNKFSNGWLEEFKNWHGIAHYVSHGEAGSVNLTNVDDEQVWVQKILDGWDLNNVFNAETTSFFWREDLPALHCYSSKTMVLP